MYKYLTLIFSFCTLFTHAQSQWSLQEFEHQFLKNNLVLLAEQYNINVEKAKIIQAKLWDNPYFSAELNAANPEDKKAFNIQRDGQKAFAIQQLIYLGGKKKNEVELAKTNADIAELSYKDLLRNLKFQLRTSFFSAYYDQVAVSALDKQLTNLDSLIQAYSLQVQKGNIPLKDQVRLQSLYMSLKNDRTALTNDIIEQQSKLLLLISSETPAIPQPTTEEINNYQKNLATDLDRLQSIALNSRADLLMADKYKDAAQWNLNWQKSLSVPDLTLGASYDQRGGAFNNQVNLTIGLPLRLWNRNQGNIKAAHEQLQQANVQKSAQDLQIRNEVNAAYKKYLEARANYRSYEVAMQKHLDEVYQGLYLNFQKRNVSLIEFTDFMESYNQSMIQFNQIQKSLTNACEEINYATGSNIF